MATFGRMAQLLGIQTSSSFQQETTNSNSAFNSFKSEVASSTMSSAQEQKPFARQENTNTSQTMDVPLIPQQQSNNHFESFFTLGKHNVVATEPRDSS